MFSNDPIVRHASPSMNPFRQSAQERSASPFDETLDSLRGPPVPRSQSVYSGLFDNGSAPGLLTASKRTLVHPAEDPFAADGDQYVDYNENALSSDDSLVECESKFDVRTTERPIYGSRASSSSTLPDSHTKISPHRQRPTHRQRPVHSSGHSNPPREHRSNRERPQRGSSDRDRERRPHTPRHNSSGHPDEASSEHRRERRLRSKSESHSHSHSKSKNKDSRQLDSIDKMDATGLFSSGRFHHDGPFDACTPARNKNTRRNRFKAPPVSAFQPDGPNNSLAITGHESDLFRTQNAVFGMDPDAEPPLGHARPSKEASTLGLGSSTFLNGARASGDAIIEAQRGDDVGEPKERLGILGRVKSLRSRK